MSLRCSWRRMVERGYPQGALRVFFFDLVAGVASNLFLSLPMTFVAGDAN